MKYNWDNPNCPVVMAAIERNKEFFNRNNGIPEVKLENIEGKPIKCKGCNSQRFKMYTKFGGISYGKGGKVVNSVPIKYNFSCGCGKMLVILEGTFKYGRIKYGCKAVKCPLGKVKMDKGCITCEFIYEK